MSITVHIGHEKSEFVAIEVAYRLYPNADDYWDANWIHGIIKCHFGGFKGSFTANLRTSEFARFHKEIQTLSKTLKGKAVFEAMEEQVILSLEGDGKGNIGISGTLKDEAGTGNDLIFHSSIDQTFLKRIENELSAINEKFPILNENKK